MKYRNKIKEILEDKNISILELSKKIDSAYRNLYELVNGDYLDSKTFGKIADIADYLDVEIEDLYEVDSNGD